MSITLEPIALGSGSRELCFGVTELSAIKSELNAIDRINCDRVC